MKEKQMTVSLETAKKWYDSGNPELQTLALNLFTLEELYSGDYPKIKTFDDALGVYCKFEGIANEVVNVLNCTQNISPAMELRLKLYIVKAALNEGYAFSLGDNQYDEHIWVPIVTFVKSGYQDKNLSDYTHLGSFSVYDDTYDIYGGTAMAASGKGLGNMHNENIGVPFLDIAYLGCATEDIAKHFSKYFGTMIIESMYGNIPGFQNLTRTLLK